MIREDFIMDENGDFPLEDLYVSGVLQDTPHGESDYQHTGDIIIAHPGWYKQSPSTGFGIMRIYQSEISLHTVFNELSSQMKKDGYRVSIGAVFPGDNGAIFVDNRFIFPK